MFIIIEDNYRLKRIRIASFVKNTGKCIIGIGITPSLSSYYSHLFHVFSGFRKNKNNKLI